MSCCTRSDTEWTARVPPVTSARCVAPFCLTRLQSAARFLERYTTVLPCPARAVGGFVSLCDRLQVRPSLRTLSGAFTSDLVLRSLGAPLPRLLLDLFCDTR